MHPFAALVLCALTTLQEDPRALVEKLRSDTIEERDQAVVGLRRLGKAAVLDLEKATGDRDSEVACRAREILASIDPALRHQVHLDRIESSSADAHLNLSTYCVAVGAWELGALEVETVARLDRPGKGTRIGARTEHARVIFRSFDKAIAEDQWDAAGKLYRVLWEYDDTPYSTDIQQLPTRVLGAFRERDSRRLGKDTSDGLKALLKLREEEERREVERSRPQH
jgi:hypothetical protein